MKTNLFGLFEQEIVELIKPFGLRKFRASQIVDWIYQKKICTFDEMINISLADRAILKKHFYVFSVKLKTAQTSADQKTTKYLLEYEDGIFIETVLMRQPYGNSVCVSTQAGCAMGCKFCASTLHGLQRNLSSQEIFSQVFFVQADLNKHQQRVDTIVIMGSGEPLSNYEAVVQFIRLCHETYTFHLSYRNITLSTSGLVPMIDRLRDEKLPITLSISLHGSNDSVRSDLMPINKIYNIQTVITAAAKYAQKTGRRVTYEYILIKDVNDSVEDAASLSRLLRGQLANVNLIPINPVEESGLKKPTESSIVRFASILKQRHINVTIRKEMGKDIQAACGQLRNRHL